MPHEQLDNLVKVRQLKAEPPSEQEVAGSDQLRPRSSPRRRQRIAQYRVTI